jgi:hypothetical protein
MASPSLLAITAHCEKTHRPLEIVPTPVLPPVTNVDPKTLKSLLADTSDGLRRRMVSVHSLL